MTPEYVTAKRVDGGLAHYIKKTAAGLAGRDCDIHVFVLSDLDRMWHDGEVTIHEAKRVSIPGLILSKIPFLHHFSAVVTQLLDARKLARRFTECHRACPFDLIQASSYKAPGYALLGNGKVPLVCRVSSYTPVVRTAYGNKRVLADYLSDWLELSQVTDADAAFAPSLFTAQLFRKVEGVKVDLVKTSLDVRETNEDFSLFDLHKPEGRYLLYFGTLSRIKGVDLLAEALPPLFAKYPNLFCLFIGRDDRLPCGNTLFSYVRDRCGGFSGRLWYHQAVDKTRLYPFIRHAEAVLMPSRADNCPNACLEAQVFGKPVIGTYESSLDEMIVDGETGFLARNGDAASIRDAIDRHLSLSEQSKDIMRRAILAQSEKIAGEDRIGKLLDFYRDVVTRFSARDWHEQ